MIAAGVHDPGFRGPKHTWTNNQQGDQHVWVRLDRVLINGAALASFLGIQVTHLDRGTSDHMPLFIQTVVLSRPKRSFKYLRMWSSYENFLSTVATAWGEVSCSNPIINFVQKLKIVAKRLSYWNIHQFGNLDKSIMQGEEKIASAESLLLNGWSDRATADLAESKDKLYTTLRRKQILLEDQARTSWLSHGDENTSFFRASIRERAFYAKPALRKEDGSDFESDKEVADALSNHFCDLLQGHHHLSRPDLCE